MGLIAERWMGRELLAIGSIEKSMVGQVWLGWEMFRVQVEYWLGFSDTVKVFRGGLGRASLSGALGDVFGGCSLCR